MQHQFKAGDLALIIGALTEPGMENIGKVVELAAFIQLGRRIEFEGQPWQPLEADAWIVRGENLVSIRSSAELGLYSVSDVGLCMVAARFLMPLKGDQSPAQNNTETPKEVVHG